jgi:hypothetical protein
MVIQVSQRQVPATVGSLDCGAIILQHCFKMRLEVRSDENGSESTARGDPEQNRYQDASPYMRLADLAEARKSRNLGCRFFFQRAQQTVQNSNARACQSILLSSLRCIPIARLCDLEVRRGNYEGAIRAGRVFRSHEPNCCLGGVRGTVQISLFMTVAGT